MSEVCRELGSFGKDSGHGVPNNGVSTTLLSWIETWKSDVGGVSNGVLRECISGLKLNQFNIGNQVGAGLS